MPPQNTNQEEQNNLIPPQNIPPVVGNSKNKRGIVFLVILAVVLIIALIVGFNIYLSSRKTGPEKPVLSKATQLYFENYADNLVKNLGISDDPFNLSPSSKITLSDISDAIKTSDVAGAGIIFNGKVFDKLEVTSDDNAHYLKPAGYNGQFSEYLVVIKKKVIDINQFYNSNDLEDQVLRMFYDEFEKHGGTQDVTYASVARSLKEILDQKVSSGLISSYQIDSKGDTISIIYKNGDIPYEIMPYEHAEGVKFVVDSYADPAIYASTALANISQQLTNDKILIINTKSNSQYYAFVNKDRLQNDLSVLLDPASDKTKKIYLISNSVKIDDGESFTVLLPAAALSAVPPLVLNDVALLNESGTIVPVKKTINYFESPEYYGTLDDNDKTLNDLLDPSGSFRPFYQNGYGANPVVIQREKKSVELLKSLISQEGDILYLHSHGEDCGLLTEIYYIGPQDSPDSASYLKNIKDFRARRDDLLSHYSDKELLIGIRHRVLNTANGGGMRTIGPGEAEKLEMNIKNWDDFGVVWVLDKFFENYSQKKTLFISYACKGGCLKDFVPSRVMLAVDRTVLANSIDFPNDLEKISKYLFKDINVDANLITKDDMRSYDVVPKLNLAQIHLYGQAGQTIAVSPHVKSINYGDSVSFNAPLEINNIDPASVVTIDASQCQTPQKVLDENKPKWQGDKDITLSWKDKAYRDWNSSTDIGADGNPKVNWAVITVKNDQAISKISKVRLTGNPDACTKSGCSQKESWVDPAGVKYNGNQPNTDFVFTMPCIDEAYYSPCDSGTKPDLVKIKDEKGERAGLAFPEFIKSNGNCYNKTTPSDADKAKAVEVKDWTEDKNCQDKCITVGGDCLTHIIEKKVIKNYDKKQTNVDINSKTTYVSGDTEALFLDGKVIESCISKSGFDYKTGKSFDIKCIEPRIFGDHLGWIKVQNNDGYDTTYSIIYDNKVYDKGKDFLSNLFLYNDDVLYEKSPTGEAPHVIYNKKDYGDLNIQLSLLKDPDYLHLPYFKRIIDVIHGVKYNDHSENPVPVIFDQSLVGDRVSEARKQSEESLKMCFPPDDHRMAREACRKNWDSICKHEEEVYKEQEADYSNCIEAAKKETCQNTESQTFRDYCSGLILNPSIMGYVDDKPLLLTDLDGGGNSGVDKPAADAAMYFDESFYDLGGERYHFSLEDVFGQDFATLVSNDEDSAASIYLNGRKKYDDEGIDLTDITIFSTNYLAYTDKNGFVVYNGKVLDKLRIGGSEEKVVLYQNHVAFPVSNDRVYLDGQYYNDESSILTNISACRQDYLDGNH